MAQIQFIDLSAQVQMKNSNEDPTDLSRSVIVSSIPCLARILLLLQDGAYINRRGWICKNNRAFTTECLYRLRWVTISALWRHHFIEWSPGGDAARMPNGKAGW